MKDWKLKITAKPKDALIFGLFCLFLLYLVAIAVLNLNSLAETNKLCGLSPFRAFTPKFLPATLTIYVLAIIGVLMSTSKYFFDTEKGFGFGKKKDKDEGWARWFKEDEMKNAYNIKKIRLLDDEYKSSGIPVILEEKYAWVDDGENHSLIIGASGSGKTATILDPQVKILGKGGESMLITDPKGEIYEHNAELLRSKGYNVILVNFRDPDQGAAWNPLTLPYRYWKDGKEDKAMELLEDLATNILVDANNNDPFWQKSAADYFTGLALGLFEDAKSEDEVNLNSINAMSTFGEEKCGSSKYDKEYFKLKGELSSAYISAAATVLAPADTKGGITSTFRQKIRIFSSRQKLAEMLSYTSFDVRKIGSEKTAIFLKVHDEKTTYHALATIFVKQLYECLIDEAQKCPNQKLPIRTNFILDEFANMPALKDVESMITASRSRNIRFNFGIQNFSQLNKVYGKDIAETIKGNCGNMFYLITTEYAALEELSKLLGDAKPKEAKEGKPQEPIRPLVTVSDLQQMKKFEMIIKRWRNQPFKTKHTPGFEITKKHGWGFEEKISGYPTREMREIQTFDIKKFVDENRKQDDNPFASPFGSPFVPPFGAPSIGKAPSSAPTANAKPANTTEDLVRRIDEQIAKIEAEEKANEGKTAKTNDFEALVNKKYEEFKETKEEPVKEPSKIIEDKYDEPTGMPSDEGGINIDDLLKRIDAKIAELEEEEAREEAQKAKQTPIKEEPRVIEPTINEEPKIVETPQIHEEPIINEEPTIIDNPVIEEKPIVEEKPIIGTEIQKPSVNVDADSIVMENHITDDEFFDDFFGEDE